ncbi:hypothetical protein [Rhodococcus daqingensis]|uniref:Uncharacterized protein n=1 Tax=Rhodococcus daqingensis TaxID=2479363 RepID=A0ABW2RY14_9NOCA
MLTGFSLENRIAVITGGGQNTGLGIAHTLAAAGEFVTGQTIRLSGGSYAGR